MSLLRQILHDLALVTLVVAGVLACVVLYKGIGIENASTGTLGGVNAALATVNQGCAPGPCGTLAAFTKVVTKAGDATVTTQIQEQAIGKQVSATMTALQTIPAHVNGTMDSLTGTAQTASTSLQTITDGITPVLASTEAAVRQAGAMVAGLQPVEVAATKTVQDADALVTSPDVTRFLKGSADTSQQVAIIATQGAAVAADVHKEADSLVAPKPWWKQVYTYGNTGVNVACLVTHSCPI
jgi:hypothetical protein